jgi:hypothetical protein
VARKQVPRTRLGQYEYNDNPQSVEAPSDDNAGLKYRHRLSNKQKHDNQHRNGLLITEMLLNVQKEKTSLSFSRLVHRRALINKST